MSDDLGIRIAPCGCCKIVDSVGLTALLAERDEARARLVALLEAISMLGKGEVAAYERAAARGDS